MLGSFLQRNISIKLIILMSGAISLGGMCLAAWAKDLQTFIIGYAVLFPFGSGLLFYPPLMCAWEWFGHLKGLCTGIIIAGFGFGTFIFSFVSTSIVNPDNAPRELDPTSGDIYFS